MIAPKMLFEAEVISTKVKIADDGTVGVLHLFDSDERPLALTLAREELERLRDRIDRELKRVPKPVRGRS